MKRLTWLDNLRGIAIVAVVVDHALYLYPQFRNEIIWKHMYFSVPWFVFLAGYTSSLSVRARGWKLPVSALKYWQRRWTIPVWYALAALFIYWFDTRNSFSLAQFVLRLLLFSIEPTYYFINLIMQFYAFFPLVISLILPVKNFVTRIVLLLTVYIISEYVLMRQAAPWPFAPAGRILGGLYLTVFVAGIIAALDDILSKRISIIIATFIFAYYEFLFLSTSGSFIGIIPNITSLIWAVSLLVVVAGFLQNIPLHFVHTILEFLGKNSLTIYLFHFFILRYFYTWTQTAFGFFGVIIIALFTGSLLAAAMEWLAFRLKTRRVVT